MRLLFMQVSLHGAAEYNSQRALADAANPYQLDYRFAWQANTQDRRLNPSTAEGRDFFHDFGRNMALTPRPSRARRASMLLYGLSTGFFFLNKHISSVGPDAIYTSHQTYDVFFGHLFSKIYRIPHIIHVHYPIAWLDKPTVRTILRTPRLVAASEFIRRGLIEAGAAPHTVHTRHEVIPLERYELPGDGAAVRSEFGWPPHTPVVVAAGRLDPSKGHLLLFDAFARVVQKCPDARLLVCGWATYPGYDTVLKQRVTHLGLDGSVVFAGTRPDMPGIYAGADVFCLPTVDDACPLVFLEAMAAGLPTVGVVSGGVPEMVVDGATGLLSAPGDASALATSLLTLLRDPSLRARLGNAGKERVQEVFAPRRAAAEWMTVLHRLLPHVAGRTARRTRTRPAAPGQLHPLAV